ncbi:hypothetical protein I553_3707 [Mycobacterium xenopi 4042]|uniref:Uncharacterized protein n=1 Tax=Mycobacterium xenopi 4042 TaxID=1299334 RepID=X7YSY8_MYCXE|nr:hypothetical protein I553_3707 [Mycobacterium xenopi 4042]
MFRAELTRQWFFTARYRDRGRGQFEAISKHPVENSAELEAGHQAASSCNAWLTWCSPTATVKSAPNSSSTSLSVDWSASMPDDTTLPADAPAPWDTVDDELPGESRPNGSPTSWPPTTAGTSCAPTSPRSTKASPIRHPGGRCGAHWPSTGAGAHGSPAGYAPTSKSPTTRSPATGLTPTSRPGRDGSFALLMMRSTDSATKPTRPWRGRGPSMLATRR